MKRFFFVAIALLSFVRVVAQQLPNASFEDWSGSTFDGEPQPKDWHACNVTQFGFKFNFAHREAGHTGQYSMMVQDQNVGAAGITATSPGYFCLGQPWAYVESLTKVNEATAGTCGGIAWKYRPDTMAVWIRRTGADALREDFHLLYYAWRGSSRGVAYKGKNGNCTSISQIDEESDIRLSTNGNECGTAESATQICEGWFYEKNVYNDWTLMKVPIYYMSDEVPEKFNIIFSASNYPSFRANTGLYAGNSLYVDDVQLIYSSRIQKLYIDGMVWNGFNPYSEEEQIYSLGESATEVPEIVAMRGVGQLVNGKDQVASFSGRRLQGSELTIQKGAVGEVTTLTVRAEDGSSTTTYRIRFTKAASSNANLSEIWMTMPSGQRTKVENFNPYVKTTEVILPYGTTAVPVIDVEKQEASQTVKVTQASSLSQSATIEVTAADGATKKTYIVTFRVAQLSDNTLSDILVNGESVAGFVPSQTLYWVSLPLGTTVMPTIRPVSAYPDGEQTITLVAPEKIDGGVYLVKVSTPGNPTPKIYKLNFKLQASTYSLLKSLEVGDGLLTHFESDVFTYYVSLDTGTVDLPAIRWTQGDQYQTVTPTYGGVNGTTLISVKAASGAQSVYKIVFTTPLSHEVRLSAVYLNGQLVSSFSPDQRTYEVSLPLGTTTLPTITWQTMDRFQTVSLAATSLDEPARLTVKAGDGSMMVYTLTFSVEQNTYCYLSSLSVGGKPIEGFAPEQLEYTYLLQQGITSLPEVTYLLGDSSQKVTVRKPVSLNGDYKLIVRAESGATKTYTIHFLTTLSGNTHLKAIYLDGELLSGFAPDKYEYTLSLPSRRIPTVSAEKAEKSQRVLSTLTDTVHTLTVTAENGNQQVYRITFSIKRSENAYLKNIYLSGTPIDSFLMPSSSFSKEKMNYEVTLPNLSIPVITIEKDIDLSATIVTPQSAGEATILVSNTMGDQNTYTILFTQPMGDIQVDGILVDGQPLVGFNSHVYSYSLSYSGSFPEVEVLTRSGQTAHIFRKGSQVLVCVEEGNEVVTYTLTLQQDISPSSYLKAILVNGDTLPSFVPTTLDYEVHLPAGSPLPVISYVKDNDAETIVLGQKSRLLTEILVTSQDGSSETAYHVQVVYDPYSNPYLSDLQVEGKTLPFSPTTLTYTLSHDDNVDLPRVIPSPCAGQTVFCYERDADTYVVSVTAEDGSTAEYVISFTRLRSDNTALTDILIDGQSLRGFDAHTYLYTDTLDWRTSIVPNVFPVGALPTQTITTSFSPVNDTVWIHVLAPDSVHEAYYGVYFPVRKSANTALGMLAIDHETLTLSYHPSRYQYDIYLPYGDTILPSILFSKAEDEQQIRFTSRPINLPSEIVVRAENGDTATYKVTFHATPSPLPNKLQSIFVAETGLTLNAATAPSDTLEVPLPYGCRTMTIDYEKSFPEQTVCVQPGGVRDTTIITVISHRPDDPNRVYRLIPRPVSAHPAVLSAVSVNGSPLPDFDPHRFSYIVPVTDRAIVRPTAAKGATVNVTIQNNKHWQAEVTYDTLVSTYDLWFYYTHDVLPNTDFSEWENASYKGTKPVGWNTLGQFTSGCTIKPVGTYTTGNEVRQDGTRDVVVMESRYNAFPLGGYVPAYITLGTINASFDVAAGSDFSVSGGVTFRNSPDLMSVRYKQTAISNNASRILCQIGGDLSQQQVLFTNTQTHSDFTIANLDLRAANALAGVPQTMNIILNSFESESGLNGLNAQAATMYVDYCRFAFSSTLKGMRVNGSTATLTDHDFSFTLTDPEDILLPRLSFLGDVSDQAQTVIWENNGEETPSGKYAVRRATITNWAEDGTTHTLYTLEVRRPLSTINVLSGLRIGNNTLPTFHPDTLHYTLHLTSSDRIPDIVPIRASSRQRVALSETGNTWNISVLSETGDTRTYSVTYVLDTDSTTTLTYLSDVDSFTPSQRTYSYSGTTLPVFQFTKASPTQTVTIDGGLCTVTAEDGSVGKYIISLSRPEVTTSATLTEIELDGQVLPSFSPDKYNYQSSRPSYTSFVRKDAADSVVFVQHPRYMEWRLFAANGTQHSYTLTYPAAESNALLDAILLGDSLLPMFLPTQFAYTIYADTTLVLSARKADPAQTLSVSRSESTYTLSVTSPDNASKATYTVQITPPLSSDATLRGLLLNEQPLATFHADSLHYTIFYPAGKEKQSAPALPSIQYIVANSGQSVEVMAGGWNDTTYLTVTSEDGKHHTTYTLFLQGEKSHNASLTSLWVNGQPVQHFEPGRHFYSESVPTETILLDWTSNDAFQTYRVDTLGSTYTLHVTAEDGLTTDQYTIDIFVNASSSNAQLANILLNDTAMSLFQHAINPKLTFDANNNKYTVYLPASVTCKPTVSATLLMAGQSAEIRSHQWGDSILVTAADSVTVNTYIIDFVVPLSSNANLKMISIDGEPLSGFSPTDYFYPIDLPIGVHTLPSVSALPAEIGQHVDSIVTSGLKTTIYVRAEDGTQNVYILLFSYTPSDQCQLAMLYADDDTIPSFSPDQYNYHLPLPVGTRTFPVLTYDSLDPWQRITRQLVYSSTYQETTQFEVESESGKKSTYSISFVVQSSAVDTLRSISIDHRPLNSFQSHILEYSYTLPADATTLPAIDYERGDALQNVRVDTLIDNLLDSKSLGKKIHISVTAENNAQRTYIIHFPIALSTDTLLSMIWNNGEPLPYFSKEQQQYDVTVPYDPSGAHVIPSITISKNHAEQNVDIVVVSDSLLLISVQAEDRNHTATYQVRIHYGRSPLSNLSAIHVNGLLLPDFHPDTLEYALTLFTTDSIPHVEWIPAAEQQQIRIDTIRSHDNNLCPLVSLTTDVIAPDEEHSRTYSLLLSFSLTALDTIPLSSSIASLSVRGIPVTTIAGFDYDFHPDTLTYIYRPYALSATNDSLFSPSDIEFTLQDPRSIVDTMVVNTELMNDTVEILESGEVVYRHIQRTISLTVSNRLGQAPRIYSIKQSIRLSRDSSVAEIYIDGKPFIDFNPDVHHYTYYIKAGTLPPLVTFTATDSLAYCNEVIPGKKWVDGVEIEYRTLICQSQYAFARDKNNNALKNTYTIDFVESSINETLSPMSTDVLLKHVTGTTDVVAASLRSMVYIGIYDISGQMVAYRMLQPINPSNAVTAKDANGQENLIDIKDISECETISLKANTIYFYCFFHNGKRRVESGKLLIQ